jgi:hypothetical protein
MLFLVSRRKGCAFEAWTLALIRENCNAPGKGCRMDALSAPESDDESLINTPSPYSQSEKRAETEGRREDTKKSGVTDAVQVAAVRKRATGGSTSTLGL